MKKFLLTTVAGLMLATNTSAAIIGSDGGGPNAGDVYYIFGTDTDEAGAGDPIFGHLKILETATSNPNPTLDITSEYFTIDGTPWSVIMDSKANQSDLTALTTTVAGLTPVQADWTEASSGATDFIKHKPTLFSGAYSDLTGKPSIPVTFDDLTVGTTNKAYTATEKTKLAGIATGATANSSDATLLNRANHTGTQAASTITGLATVAISGSYADLSSKPSIPTVPKMEALSGTTNSTGDVTLTFGNSYSTAPKVFAAIVASSPDSAHGTYYTITSLSTTSVTLRAMKGVDTGVLIGGTVDPDAIVATGTTVNVFVIQ